MKIVSRLAVIVITFLLVAIYNISDSNIYEATVNFKINNEIDLPIIMYHSFLKDDKAHGEFVISPEQLENDIEYIISNGYTPILVNELTAFQEGKGTLPEKPIMITFDDGYYNNYLYAFPILKKHNVKAVISPIAKYSELYSQHDENNAYYSHITWEQGREMVSSGLIEFQNHTYDLHSISNGGKGIQKRKNESDAQYKQHLYADLYKAHNMIKENLSFSPTALTLPFGATCKEADSVIEEMGYKVTFSSVEGVNAIYKGCDLHFLKRYNRPHGKNSEEFFDKILKKQ